MYRLPTAVVLAAIVLAAPLVACSSGLRIPGITPYKIEIQQGNFVSQEMASQLKSGMSKEQVRLVLGTPLLADVFHADRWDYVYWREAPDGKRESRKMAVFFSDGKLLRVNGDVAPLESQPGQPVPPPATTTQSGTQPADAAAPATQAPPAEGTR